MHIFAIFYVYHFRNHFAILLENFKSKYNKYCPYARGRREVLEFTIIIMWQIEHNAMAANARLFHEYLTGQSNRTRRREVSKK